MKFFMTVFNQLPDMGGICEKDNKYTSSSIGKPREQNNYPCKCPRVITRERRTGEIQQLLLNEMVTGCNNNNILNRGTAHEQKKKRLITPNGYCV